VQEDSRIDQYPKLVNGDSRVVWEWQGNMTAKGRECDCNSYQVFIDMVFMHYFFTVYLDAQIIIHIDESFSLR
jgi:hypothetical protein